MYNVVKIGGYSNRWGVAKDKTIVAKDLTYKKAVRRSRGLERGIMDVGGRCLTREERGLKPLKK